MTTRQQIPENTKAKVTTTSTTAQQLILTDVAALFNNCGVGLVSYILGREPSTGKCCLFTMKAAFGLSSGTLSLYGSASFSAAGDSQLILSIPDAVVSANKLQTKIAGLTGRTIEWTEWHKLFTSEL